MYKSFLIKYAEIAIKGKNRYLFEDALVQNIRYHLKRVEGTFHVRKENGRIYVDTEGEYDYDETVETLQRIFGIVGICPVVLVEDEGFDALAKVVCDYVDRTYPDKNFTFKVDARRARKNYPMTSMEINAAVGEKILEAFPETSVDVHHSYRDPPDDQYLFHRDPGTGRHAAWHSRSCNASFIRRNRFTGCRIYGI